MSLGGSVGEIVGVAVGAFESGYFFKASLSNISLHLTVVVVLKVPIHCGLMSDPGLTLQRFPITAGAAQPQQLG